MKTETTPEAQLQLGLESIHLHLEDAYHSLRGAEGEAQTLIEEKLGRAITRRHLSLCSQDTLAALDAVGGALVAHEQAVNDEGGVS